METIIRDLTTRFCEERLQNGQLGPLRAALQRQGLCRIERCKNVHHEAYAEVKRPCLGLHHRPFLMMQVITQMMLHHHQRASAICVDYAAF